MFCSECGQEIAEGQKFCSECGKPIAQSPTAQPPANPQATTREKLSADELRQLEYYFIASAVGCGMAALLALVRSSIVFLVVDGALATGIYLLCYMKLKEKDFEAVKMASLGLGVACGVLGLLGILGNDLGGLIGLGACGALVYSFMKLKG